MVKCILMNKSAEEEGEEKDDSNKSRNAHLMIPSYDLEILELRLWAK